MNMLLALLLVAPGTAPAPEPIYATIAQIRADPDRFHGRQVVVRGWMNACQNLSCSIKRNPNPMRNEWKDKLSIDANPSFDKIVVDWLPSEIEVSATVDATCFRGDVICMDRAPDLRGAKLLQVMRPAPRAAPKNKEN